jgi:hypothetical protein
MTVVPLSFGNFEGAAVKFIGVGIWVGIIVGVVAVVEKIVLVSKNKSHATARESTSAKNKASASIDVKPTELREDKVDVAKDKFLFDQNIKSLKAELETTSARFCEQSTLKPLGNLTYQEASRYFTEFSELLESGCGRREKESRLKTSFERMKEALKVECLNWCNLGGDFDENCELIGTGFIMLSWFLPDELAEKTNKSPDLSNVDARRAYNEASRAANEFIERRTNELNAEWNEFKKKYRTEQTPKSPPLSNAAQSQPPAIAFVSESETNNETLDHVSSITAKTFESKPGIPWMPAGIFGAVIVLPVIVSLASTYFHQQTSSLNNNFAERFGEQIEKGTPPPGFSPENFEKLKNAAKARFEQVPGVKEHQRRFEVLFAGWLADHEGQPLPDQQVMSGWFQEIQADFRKELIASEEFQAFLDRVKHLKKPHGAELAAIEGELERLTQELALSRLDAYELLSEYDRKYQRWLRGQGATLRSMAQRPESVVETKAKINMEHAEKTDFLELFRKIPAERDAGKQLTPKESSADELNRRNGIEITSPNGRSGQIDKFLVDSINQIVAHRKEYQADLDKIGWDRILDPERLAMDPRLERSKAGIRQAKEIVGKYVNQINSLLAKMRNDIDALNLSAEEKVKAREAFERGAQESSKTRNQILLLEGEIVWKCGEMIDYLYMEYGSWSVSDGQIVFSKNEKAAEYNRYVDAIEKLAAQLEQLRRYGVQ